MTKTPYRVQGSGFGVQLLLMVLALVLALPAQATITRVQSKTATTGGTNATSLAMTFDSTPTAGNTIILSIGSDSILQSITATNIQFTEVARSPTASSHCYLAIGRVFGSPGATLTVLVNAIAPISIAGAEYTSTVGLLRFDKTASATASSAAPASGATDTTNSAVELWVGSLLVRSQNTATYSSPTNSFSIVAQTGTTINTANADRSVCLLERIVSSTGTANAGATSSANNTWVAIVATLEETPAATATAELGIPSVPGR